MGDREDLKKALLEALDIAEDDGQALTDELLDEFSDGKGDEADE